MFTSSAALRARQGRGRRRRGALLRAADGKHHLRPRPPRRRRGAAAARAVPRGGGHGRPRRARRPRGRQPRRGARRCARPAREVRSRSCIWLRTQNATDAFMQPAMSLPMCLPYARMGADMRRRATWALSRLRSLLPTAPSRCTARQALQRRRRRNHGSEAGPLWMYVRVRSLVVPFRSANNAFPSLAPRGVWPWQPTLRRSRASWTATRRSVRAASRAPRRVASPLGLPTTRALLLTEAPPPQRRWRTSATSCASASTWRRSTGSAARVRHLQQKLKPIRFPVVASDEVRRAAADLESRRVDPRNKTYQHAAVDLSYPAPGCGAGPWDGVPAGHKAQPVDLEVASPVLQKLGLQPTWDGAAPRRLLWLLFAHEVRLSQAIAACLGARTWARRSRAARCGARRRRTPRLRRCATKWPSPPHCTDAQKLAGVASFYLGYRLLS